MPADLPVNFRPDAFAGTVDDYVRYRPPYDARMVSEILSRAALPAEGAQLIDLACGPGRLTFAIAEHFADGMAIDLKPKMIATARLEAERRGVRHIHRSVVRAEDLELYLRFARDFITRPPATMNATSRTSARQVRLPGRRYRQSTPRNRHPDAVWANAGGQ